MVYLWDNTQNEKDSVHGRYYIELEKKNADLIYQSAKEMLYTFF